MNLLSLAYPAHNRRATVDDASRQRRCLASPRRMLAAQHHSSFTFELLHAVREAAAPPAGGARGQGSGRTSRQGSKSRTLARRRGGVRFTCCRRGAHAALCALRANSLAKLLLRGLRFATACMRCSSQGQPTLAAMPSSEDALFRMPEIWQNFDALSVAVRSGST